MEDLLNFPLTFYQIKCIFVEIQFDYQIFELSKLSVKQEVHILCTVLSVIRQMSNQLKTLIVRQTWLAQHSFGQVYILSNPWASKALSDCVGSPINLTGPFTGLTALLETEIGPSSLRPLSRN